eukprot:2686900-Karenia_brevis.AAC.1
MTASGSSNFGLPWTASSQSHIFLTVRILIRNVLALALPDADSSNLTSWSDPAATKAKGISQRLIN